MPYVLGILKQHCVSILTFHTHYFESLFDYSSTRFIPEISYPVYTVQSMPATSV